jgi:hypothetical protein
MTEEKEKLDGQWYRNHYHCEDCNTSWDMEWDAVCDNPCPKCNKAYSPVSSEEIPEPCRKLPNREDKDLKQLALDYIENRIFTSAQTEPNVLGMVFMPLLFGGTKGMDREDIGLVYSYMSEAFKLNWTKHPMFMSCGFLNIHDNKLFWEYVDILQAQRTAFLEHKF